MGQGMKNVLAALLLSAFSLWGQGTSKNATTTEAQKKVLTEAASGGTSLPATINVVDNVNVEAVMLPKEIVRRVFGRHVSESYAVIEINISNRSNDAALIVQSLFIDLSGWGFAGPLGSGLGASGVSRPLKSKPYQSGASPKEVASVEYRIVRGQLQDAQPWTNRNLAFRSIRIVGSIGAAFAFPFSKDVVAGIGAWNGSIVPGFDVFFPDGMEAQINRISDYGYRNNKVVSQQSSDIIVAFFPIDRFLTPSLRSAFLDSPSLFFNPLLMLIDPASQKLLRPILVSAYSGNAKSMKADLAKLLDQYTKLDQEAVGNTQAKIEEAKAAIASAQAAISGDESLIEKDKAAGDRNPAALKSDQAQLEKDKESLKDSTAQLNDQQDKLNKQLENLRKIPLFNFLNTLSLNNVHIVASGVMAVNELTIPATINETCFDKADADLWAIAGRKSCFISGRFLLGGIPQILDADALGISDIKVDKDASTSELLRFTFDLKAPLDPPVAFDILVSKEGRNGKDVESMKYHVRSPF